MATPEALIKYYDCLKDSFNKIQVTDNKSALVNAALRPKIKDELVKSKDLLISYLNYIKVFTLIYSDKFSNICISVICPLFRDNPLRTSHKPTGPVDSTLIDNVAVEDVAQLVHETLRTIFKSKPELIDEFIHSVIRLFPNIQSEDEKIFTSYLNNAIEICTYVRGEPLTNLMAKILDRISPTNSKEPIENQKVQNIKDTIERLYELIYEQIDRLDGDQLENVSAAILAAFTREFLISDNEDAMNYLLLYICSKDERLADLYINLLWANFTDPDKSFEERRASVFHACSFMSRANYIGLEKVLNHIETEVAWCDHFMDNTFDQDANRIAEFPDQANDLFCPLVESILYLITQRYREMYEEETITRLKNLNLDNIFNCRFKPLVACNTQTVSRFYEVATLYGIYSLPEGFEAKTKRRKSANNSSPHHQAWKIPFKENCDHLPSRISSLYRSYYNHRNFTIYRE